MSMLIKEVGVRVTQQAKQETRQRILDAGITLFGSKGFDETTTRDISREAGIAVGTLFNYFPAKEAIVLSLVSDRLAAAGLEFHKRLDSTSTSLAERLFAHVATGLRKLRPCRKFLSTTIESCLSPATLTDGNQSIRSDHLEAVTALITDDGAAELPSAMALQLYWTLYTGVLSFWVRDTSPHQEDTLAMLDQSINMFVAWLDTQDADA